jgi:hypothetical protein
MWHFHDLSSPEFTTVGLSLRHICTMQIVNITGLLLNLAGIILMFYYTPRRTRQISFHEEEELSAILDRQDKDRRRIKAGLLLMAAGFTLQAISAIMTYSLE